MQFGTWIFARAAAYRWNLVFLFLLASLLAGTFAGMRGYVDVSTADGVRATLARTPADGRATQLRTGLAVDPVAQTAAADALFGRVFQGTSVLIHRDVEAGPFLVEKPAGPSPLHLTVRVLPEIGEHTDVVAGRWPATAVGTQVPMALLARSAAALQVGLGDTVTVAGDDTVVVGRVAAILRPIENGDPYLFAGNTDATAVVDSTAEFTADPQVSWTVSPSGRIAPEQLGPLRSELVDLQTTVNNDIAVNTGTVSQTGDLAATVAVMDASLTAARSVGPIPELLVAVLGLLLIVQASLLLGGIRRSETDLLRSRGLSAVRLAAGAGVEAAIVTVAAAAVGIAVAGIFTSISVTSAMVSAGLVVITAAAAAIVAAGRRKLSTDSDSSRFRWVVLAGPAALLVVAAVIALLRFRHLRSAVVVDATGAARLDPIAVAAAPLCLLAVAMLAAATAGLLAGAGAAVLRRRRGILVLPANELWRRWPAFGMVSLLLGLAVASTATAAIFDRTWNDFRQAVARLDNVTEVRVADPRNGDIDIGTVDPALRFDALPAVATATDALVTSTEIGDHTAELMAAPAAGMATVLPSISGGFDAGAAARELAYTPRGLEMPPGTGQVELELAVAATLAPPPDRSAPTATGVRISFIAWFAGPSGVLIPVPLGQLILRIPADAPADGSPAVVNQRVFHGTIPTGRTAGWRMVALDTTSDTDAPIVLSVDVRSVAMRRSPTGAATAVPTAGLVWAVQPTDESIAGLNLTSRSEGSIGFGGAVPPATPVATIRLMPDPPTTVPVVADQATAALLGLGPGDPLDLQLSATSRHVRATVTAIVPVLPGGSGTPRVLADLGAVSSQLLADTTSVPAPNQIWLQSASPQAAAAQAGALAGSGPVVTQVGSGMSAPLVRPVAVAFWFAAIACTILAVVSLGTIAVTMARQRRSDVAALRAVGLVARQQIALRCGELAATVLAAAVVGTAAAVVDSDLTVADMARSAVIGGALATPFPTMAPAGWLVLAAGGAAATMIIVGYGLVIARQVLNRQTFGVFE